MLGSRSSGLSGSESKEKALTIGYLFPTKILSWLRIVLLSIGWAYLFFF